MSNASRQSTGSPPLFRRLGGQEAVISVELDGRPVDGFVGDTVASLLLRTVEPERYRQSPVLGASRAPLCMMGVCFECLVEVDGERNQQGCLTLLRAGMRIRRQLPAGSSS